MKTIIKLNAVVFLLAVMISCKKENIQSRAASQLVNMDVQRIFHIGDSKGGGIIFYLDATRKHGLIAATSDQSTGISWYKGTYIKTGAQGTSIGTGATNTNKIISKQGNTGNYAALICANYTGGGFTDWYLPSKSELNQLYEHRTKVSGLDATNYWSSSESDTNNAWDQEFGGGFKFTDDKSFTIHVRAVRSF